MQRVVAQLDNEVDYAVDVGRRWPPIVDAFVDAFVDSSEEIGPDVGAAKVAPDNIIIIKGLTGDIRASQSY